MSVLNKINAANVLTLRTVQDSNKLLASLLEQQTILAKQQRDATTNAINTDIGRQASIAGNMSQVTGTHHRFTSKLPHAVERAQIDARASKELTAMQTDFLQYIFQAINNLLTQNLGFFDAMGQNLFRSFATILVVWYGVKSALASASGRHFLPLRQFREPASDHQLWLRDGQLLQHAHSRRRNQFPQPRHQRSPVSLDSDQSGATPNRGHAGCRLRISHGLSRHGEIFFGTAIYVIVTILLAAAQAIAIVVIAYGFIATAVCVLVGPVFVPFFIVPKMEWLFWGWFRCFIQYAFYQVIAAAVVYVIGNLMLGALGLPPAGTLSTVQLIGWFPVLFITFLASIYVLLKIPSLTNHIFSGTAGGSSAGLSGAPAAVLNRVM